jgi:hypothetical protein
MRLLARGLSAYCPPFCPTCVNSLNTSEAYNVFKEVGIVNLPPPNIKRAIGQVVVKYGHEK